MQIRPGKQSEGLGPVFRMVNSTTGVIKEARSEEEVFKAHFPHAPLANEAPVNDALCLGTCAKVIYISIYHTLIVSLCIWHVCVCLSRFI